MYRVSKVTELSLLSLLYTYRNDRSDRSVTFENNAFFADLQSSGHTIFCCSAEAITFPDCVKIIMRFHSALLKWQLKYCHLTDFRPKNMYRSDRTVTSVNDGNDRSDSFVIRR